MRRRLATVAHTSINCRQDNRKRADGLNGHTLGSLKLGLLHRRPLVSPGPLHQPLVQSVLPSNASGLTSPKTTTPTQNTFSPDSRDLAVNLECLLAPASIAVASFRPPRFVRSRLPTLLRGTVATTVITNRPRTPVACWTIECCYNGSQSLALPSHRQSFWLRAVVALSVV
jgi:hypothetical protein